MASANTLIMASYDDLKRLLDEEKAKAAIREHLSQFDNVLVGTKEVAKFHSVNERTVLAYIKDGLIEPEIKVGEKDHYRFRASYMLSLNFKELHKKLMAKSRGW